MVTATVKTVAVACGPYRGALNRFDQAACGSNGGGCGCDGPCDPCCGRSWYASVSALVMGRSDSGTLWTSYKQSDQTVQAGNTNFGLHWQWGGEVRFGHCFCCGCTPYALEATYWTTEAFTGCRTTSFPGDTVNTVLSVDNITFQSRQRRRHAGQYLVQGRRRADALPAGRVPQHRSQLDPPAAGLGLRFALGRRLVGGRALLPLPGGADVRLGHAGPRPGDVYDAYLSDNVTNNLVGVQVGFDVAYNLCSGLWVFITPKVGIYNNFIDSTFQAATRQRTLQRFQQSLRNVLSDPRHHERAVLPDPDRRGRRVAIYAKLECAGRLPRGRRHGRGLGRRAVSRSTSATCPDSKPWRIPAASCCTACSWG